MSRQNGNCFCQGFAELGTVPFPAIHQRAAPGLDFNKIAEKGTVPNSAKAMLFASLSFVFLGFPVGFLGLGEA